MSHKCNHSTENDSFSRSFSNIFFCFLKDLTTYYVDCECVIKRCSKLRKINLQYYWKNFFLFVKLLNKTFKQPYQRVPLYTVFLKNNQKFNRIKRMLSINCRGNINKIELTNYKIGDGDEFMLFLSVS